MTRLLPLSFVLPCSDSLSISPPSISFAESLDCFTDCSTSCSDWVECLLKTHQASLSPSDLLLSLGLSLSVIYCTIYFYPHLFIRLYLGVCRLCAALCSCVSNMCVKHFVTARLFKKQKKWKYENSFTYLLYNSVLYLKKKTTAEGHPAVAIVIACMNSLHGRWMGGFYFLMATCRHIPLPY